MLCEYKDICTIVAFFGSNDRDGAVRLTERLRYLHATFHHPVQVQVQVFTIQHLEIQYDEWHNKCTLR